MAYGDSNCVDGAHLQKPCYWLMDAMLEFTSAGHVPQILRENAARSIKPLDILPQRMEKNKLHRYSKVRQTFNSQLNYIRELRA